jgi:hypothetical protein
VKLYNTTVRVVELVWADSPAEAVTKLAGRVARQVPEFEVLDGEAFVSEPVESHGWAGDGEG